MCRWSSSTPCSTASGSRRPPRPGPAGFEPQPQPHPAPRPEPEYGDGLEPVPLPDATVLMEQVEQLEAAMAGD